MVWRQHKIINYFKFLVVTLLIFFTVNSCFCNEYLVLAQTDQTASKLQAAKSAIRQAFNAVLDAEKAGGNVTELVSRLNSAGQLLAEAENVQRRGGTANVALNAESARQIADHVNDDSIKLLNIRFVESQNNFWLTITFSIFGTVAFVLVLWIVWKRFKWRFINKLLGMKPEVIEDAT